MNDLNSILIEGKVLRIPNEGKDEIGVHCKIIIETVRTYKKNEDDFIRETSYFTVKVYGRKLKKLCVEYLKPERKIRVIGRLKQENIEGREKVLIIADHAEFKPWG